MLRVGRISAIDYKKYIARIKYDVDNGESELVTADFPFLMAEYNCPNVDDQVWVLHRGDGQEAGLVLGRASSDKYRPEFQGKKGLWRKWFSRAQHQCYAEYADPHNGDGNDGEFLFHNDDDARGEANRITIEADTTAEIKAGTTLTLKGEGKVLVQGGIVEISGDSVVSVDGGIVNIRGDAGDVIVSAISLVTHIHPLAGSTTGPPI